jgi:hypothetical protein
MSSTYIEAWRPSEVRKHTISPETPQANGGATRMPSGTPEHRR